MEGHGGHKRGIWTEAISMGSHLGHNRPTLKDFDSKRMRWFVHFTSLTSLVSREAKLLSIKHSNVVYTSI